MDRNSIIGFILLVLLGVGYISYNQYEKSKYESYRAQIVADSLAQVKHEPVAAKAVLAEDSLAIAEDTIKTAFKGKNEVVVISNGKINLSVNTKGAYPVAASLDSFKTYHGKQTLFVFNGEQNELSYVIPYNGTSIHTKDLFFSPTITTLANGDQQLLLVSELEGGRQVQVQYLLQKDNYMMHANLRLIGFQTDLSKVNTIPMKWITRAEKTEKDLNNERLNFQNHYLFADKEHDYFTVQRTPNEVLDKPVKWFAVRTHFFNSTLIADKEFTKGNYEAVVAEGDTSHVGTNTTNMEFAVAASNDFSFGFNWLISPNDYKLLKGYNLELDEMIQMGFGIFSFVKYISKWFVIPLYEMLSAITTNVGILIMLLTLIIRLLLSFFSYKSFLSTAKMRVLKPEIDTLKEKYKDNQQQFGMEQMKLYRSAGVNPMGGCLPMLLQMPFLLAMYYFFPTSLSLRQASFLWADDLSTFDSILDFGFKIPLYGDHISLFTLIMTATSLFLAIYNKNMTPSTPEMNNPVMKYMPYVLPIMFLGWFNNMAAGLTFYYAFSNILSIVQQFVIKKFFINEDKILAQLQANKLKPAQTSKWQQRLEEMQKMQATKNKK